MTRVRVETGAGIVARTRRATTNLIVAGSLAAVLGGCETVEDLISPGEEEKLPGERISVMVLDTQLEADPRLAGAGMTLPPPVRNEAWPQPGGNPRNAVQHVAAPGVLAESWSTSAGAGSGGDARLTAPPIIAYGRIYVLDSETTVRAFDAATGDEQWERELTPEDEDADEGLGGGVAFENGRLFAATGFGTVFALDPATGEPIWTTDVGVPVRAAPTAARGRLFVITSDNQLVAMAGEDGAVLWRHRGITESAGILAATSPAVSGPVVIAPYSSGELYALRLENGNPIWNDSLTRTGNMTSLTELSDIAGRPVIDRGRVFAVSHSGRMVSIDQRTGERVWTRNIAGVQTPWVAGDYVFLVSTNAQLVALSRRDGRVRWITQLQRYRNEETRAGPIQWSGPLLAGDRLLLVSSRGVVVSASPDTGEIVETYELSEGALIAPIVANETVYVLTDGAELVALR